MALYGVSTADANAVIEMAIGGKAVTQLYEGIRKFDIRIRFPEQFRATSDDIGNLLVPTQGGSKVPDPRDRKDHREDRPLPYLPR